MARSDNAHGPWQVEGGHPDGPEHVGSVVSMVADGEVDPTGESAPAVTRRAVCSCGWSGPLHDAPRAEGALIVRRYRKQSREELAPQWRAHVAEWVPAPLDGSQEGQDTGKPRRRRQKRSESQPVPEPVPESGQPFEAVAEPEQVAEAVSEPGPAVEAVAEEPMPTGPVAVEPVTEGPADPSEALAVAAERAQAATMAAARAADELTDAVRAARVSGVSWRKIGYLVGTSGQAAHERWRSA